MKRSTLRKILTGNLHLKFMSLGLAVLSWFLVTEAGVEEMKIKQVPVEVLEPEGISVWRVSSPHVNVKLMGPAVELRTIRPADLTAQYVVEEGTPPEGLRAIDVDCEENLDFGLPAGVHVNEVEPSKIKIELVRREKVRVNVEPQLVGRPKPGFEIANVRIIPQRVSVEGPEPILGDLRAVQTLPINCDGRSESFTQRLGLENVVRGHKLQIEEAVEVKVEVSEEMGRRTLKELAIVVMMPAGWKREVTVSPDTIDVTVSGQKQIVAVLKPGKVVPFVRVVEDEGGAYKLPVEVKVYLEGVEVVGVLPNVDVTVGK